jgi:primosomal protein N' (replication factor Y)
MIDFFGPELITTYHSKRTPAQQRNAWIEVHDNTQPRIILGPRSALFLPYKNLGLIIVDEAHDGSYKQDTGTRYNGLVTAGALAKEHSAQLILASATPPVQETQQILAKGGRLVCMHSLAKKNQKNQRKFTVVDMTDKKNMSAIPLLSKTLLGTIEKSLQNKKQTLLFLNKRGTARMLLCENCGWYAECPRCEVPLTHHHDEFILQCNLCGLTRKSKTTCPQCAQALSLKSPGIKAVEEELHKLFPSAKISRFDSDNRKADTFSEQYSAIKSGGADIIIGTQLITKGLDLPLLETVGIIQADSALMLPDYSSEERAFQQLTQVSGRVGRGHSDSAQVIVQSYQADSYLFDFVKNQDWHGFFEQEIKKRKANNYPPYSYAAKIWVTKSSKDKAMQACNELVALFLNKKNLRVLGPAPSFYEKIRGKYSWKLILMSSNRKLLAESVRDLPKDFYYDLDPTSLL